MSLHRRSRLFETLNFAYIWAMTPEGSRGESWYCVRFVELNDAGSMGSGLMAGDGRE